MSFRGIVNNAVLMGAYALKTAVKKTDEALATEGSKAVLATCAVIGTLMIIIGLGAQSPCTWGLGVGLDVLVALAAFRQHYNNIMASKDEQRLMQ